MADAINRISDTFDGLWDAGTVRDSGFLGPDFVRNNVEFFAADGAPPWLDAVADTVLVGRNFFSALSLPKDVSRAIKASKDCHVANDLRTRVMKGCDAAYYSMGAVTRVTALFKFIDGVAKLFTTAMSRLAAAFMWVVGIVHNILGAIRAVWDIIKTAITLSYLNSNDADLLNRIDPSDRKGGLLAFFNNPRTTDDMKLAAINKLFWSNVLGMLFHCAAFLLSVLLIVLAITMPVVALWLSVAVLVVGNVTYLSGLGGDVFDAFFNPKMTG